MDRDTNIDQPASPCHGKDSTIKTKVSLQSIQFYFYIHLALVNIHMLYTKYKLIFTLRHHHSFTRLVNHSLTCNSYCIFLVKVWTLTIK